MSLKWMKLLFALAGIYNFFLGLAFFAWHETIFPLLDIEPAGHPTYIEFSALMVAMFGVMFLQISTNPARFRNMIPYGMAEKGIFAGLALFYMITTGVSAIWIPLAVIDFAFLAIFTLAWISVTGADGDS